MFIHRENALKRPPIYISYCSIQRDHLKNNFNAKSDQNIHHKMIRRTKLRFFYFSTVEHVP